MRLWSFQTPAAVETLRTEGILRADGRRACPSFRPAYRWMREQFKLRVPGGTGRPLLWAWQSPKPDLRKTMYSSDRPSVLIALEVDPARVLLSDFDAWHFVLNNHYLPADREDDATWEARWGARVIAERDTRSDLSPRQLADVIDAEFREEMEASWVRIFDLPLMTALLRDPYYGRPDYEPYVQAVLEEIRIDDVLSIRDVRARASR